MSIQVGERIPSVTLSWMGSDGPTTISTDELFKGKKVVLFAVPGAFTPACSEQHLPGFVQLADDMKAKGVDAIACVAVNDVFVMDAWGKGHNVGDKVLMLADGDAEFTKAIGQVFDLQGKGFGLRSQRYAAIIEDGVLKSIEVEQPGQVEVSKAEKVLLNL
ncbi:peroxiredoxin [Chroococcidiopsis sp.]|uniref:peroxiredoxin n=1 Tax=Chroococcidiopsis sp. TaxID=3088168 RepID=UPI003F2BD9DA